MLRDTTGSAILNQIVGDVSGGKPWTIGQDWDSNPARRTDYYDGKMDELAIYNRALSEGEIKAIYAAAQCTGDVTSDGHNLLHGVDCFATQADTDVTGDPQLGPLQDNGGPTFTQALLEGSPAIDAGICTDSDGNPVPTDQRGFGRPQGEDCDIGAFEGRRSAEIRVDISSDEFGESGVGLGCSLREAVQAANSDWEVGGCPGGIGADTIILPAGDYNLDIVGENMALNRPASQSSTAYDGSASRAVDGNTSGHWSHNSVTHTHPEQCAWWQVDLGISKEIDEIKLWNRTDCCSGRLSNFYVFVSDNAFTSNNPPDTTKSQPGVWSAYHDGAAATTVSFTAADFTLPEPDGTTGTPWGRYVRVQLTGSDPLSLAEVQVYPIGGDLDIASDLTIQGAGAATTVIDAQWLEDRVLHVHSDQTVTVTGTPS